MKFQQLLDRWFSWNLPNNNSTFLNRNRLCILRVAMFLHCWQFLIDYWCPNGLIYETLSPPSWYLHEKKSPDIPNRKCTWRISSLTEWVAIISATVIQAPLYPTIYFGLNLVPARRVCWLFLHKECRNGGYGLVWHRRDFRPLGQIININHSILVSVGLSGICPHPINWSWDRDGSKQWVTALPVLYVAHVQVPLLQWVMSPCIPGYQ